MEDELMATEAKQPATLTILLRDGTKIDLTAEELRALRRMQEVK